MRITRGERASCVADAGHLERACLPVSGDVGGKPLGMVLSPERTLVLTVEAAHTETLPDGATWQVLCSHGELASGPVTFV